MNVVDWSRAQFAMTAIYHWLFVPLTLGLGFICAIMETLYYRTGDPFWKRTTKFWIRIFAINFAIGVATVSVPRWPSRALWPFSWKLRFSP